MTSQDHSPPDGCPFSSRPRRKEAPPSPRVTPILESKFFHFPSLVSGDDMPCRSASVTHPVFETLTCAWLVPVMQSCQQEGHPRRAQGGSSCESLPEWPGGVLGAEKRVGLEWSQTIWVAPKAGTHPGCLRALGPGLGSWVGKLWPDMVKGIPENQRDLDQIPARPLSSGVPPPCVLIWEMKVMLASTCLIGLLRGTKERDVGRNAL